MAKSELPRFHRRQSALTCYEGDGRRKSPYDPRMMMKLLIYGYATGVFSSRGIARKLEEDVAFRVLAADNFPSHRKICEFRSRHLEDFKKLFVEVVGLAQELGMAHFGKLSIDGTKVRANESKRKAMSYERMHQYECLSASSCNHLKNNDRSKPHIATLSCLHSIATQTNAR